MQPTEEALTTDAARDFRLQFQKARDNALKNAEAFDGIIYVLERLGSLLLGRMENLGKYRAKIEALAQLSAMANEVPRVHRNVHVPFTQLYSIIKDGRNDALHVGASARHLTAHAVELALVLEDALRNCEDCGVVVSDYMVRDPVRACLWQPVSLIRQRMLTNSFSYLPAQDTRGQWCLISDLQLARYLQGHSHKERNRRLANRLQDTEIEPLRATCLTESDGVDVALEKFGTDGKPILIVRAVAELVGILTVYDLL